MALSNKKTYKVLNYCSSPIAVSCRNENVLIAGGTSDNPGCWNFDIDEIIQINNTSRVFKIGLLWFEPEFEEDIYNELKIHDYKNILRNEEIEDIILNPTAESMEKLISTTDQMLYSRIYGIFMGLRNAGFNISSKVDDVMRRRYREFQNHKTSTEIKFATPDLPKKSKEIESLEARIAQLEALLTANTQPQPEPEVAKVFTADAVPESDVEPPKPAETKPKTTRKAKTTKTT